MYGRKARIGVIIPSTNTVVESEFNRMAPPGVSIHATRLLITETTPEALKKMAEDTERAAKELATAKVNVLVYACTSGSFIEGPEWEEKLVRRIQSASDGIPTLTTSGAVKRALNSLNITRFSLTTPYIDEINTREEEYFKRQGFTVVRSSGLGIVKNTEIGSLPPETAYTSAKKVHHPEAEGIFISCTDFRTIEIIPLLEKELGIPVISSSQASMWAALRSAGVRESVEGFGSLLTTQ